MKSAVVSAGGDILCRVNTPLDAASADWPQTVRKALAALEQDHGRAAGVGVAGPGIAQPDGRAIWWMQGRLGEIQGLNWSDFLGRASHVPVLNDAQAALLGEAWIGSAAGQQNVAMLTLGTGVGGAAMVDGRLLRGHVGRAGHLGHISLNPVGTPDITRCPGSLEEAVGNCSIQRRTGGLYASVLALAEAALRGEPRAAAMWAESVRALAAGVVSIVNVLDPAVVVIGGGISAAGDALFLPFARELDELEWRPHGHAVRIVRATLGEFAGAIGSARNAMTLV
jgi:glucokinase